MRTRTKNARFADNSAFNKYIELLIEHERAVARGDDEEADRIADEACDLSVHFTHEESRWLRGLSGDLKVLSGGQSFLPTSLTEQEIKHAVVLALQRGDAVTALKHLRYAWFLHRQFLAYFFGQAYEIAGYATVAIEFMRCAIELAPDQQFFTCMLLQMLDRGGRSEEAIQVALASLNRSNADPVLIIAAAGALRMATRRMNDDEAQPLLGQATQAISRLLSSEEVLARLDPESYYMATWLLASCNESLGRKDEALQLYSFLISINPNDPDAYAMRGHLLMERDEQAAISDYRNAVKLRTAAIGPYLVLANEAIKRGRYEDVHRLCSAALKLPTINPKAMAAALEYLAISSFEVGGEERNKTIALFEKAIKLDPGNSRMRSNYRLIREKLGNIQQVTGVIVQYPELSAVWQKGRPGQEDGMPAPAITSNFKRNVEREIALSA